MPQWSGRGAQNQAVSLGNVLAPVLPTWHPGGPRSDRETNCPGFVREPSREPVMKRGKVYTLLLAVVCHPMGQVCMTGLKSAYRNRERERERERERTC